MRKLPYTDNIETTLSHTLQPILSKDGKEKSRKEKATEDFNYSKPVALQVIFNDLQDKYGIEIVVESENMHNCLFTGDLSKQDVYKKLELICLAVDARFDVREQRY